MSDKALLDYLTQYPDTRYLDVLHSDLSGIIRGKRYPIQQANSLFTDGLMIPGSSFLLAVTGECMDPCGIGMTDGDPDQHGYMLADTLFPVPWAQLPTAQVQLSLNDSDGLGYYYEPRNVLAKVLDLFKPLGLTPVVSFELEFYLFDLINDIDNQLRPPVSPLTGNRNLGTQVYSLAEVEDFAYLIDDIISACDVQHIQTGAITAEYAPGQFEINLKHSSNALKAADQAAMFKRIVKGVARRHKLRASFMSKPYLDNAGSGLHIHLSMIDKNGNNLFAGEGEYPNNSCLSDLLKFSVGGLLDTMAESMLLCASNINAFRRYVPDIFVPINASWALENRSVAVRIPKSGADARRLEHRVAGADANPYLLLAALLASIHHGITNKINPSEPWQGNASQEYGKDIPFDIKSAIEALKNSQTYKHYFGDDYINAFCACKNLEYQEFLNRKIINEASWYL